MVIAENDCAECIIYNKLKPSTPDSRILNFHTNISTSELYEEIRTIFDLSEKFLVAFNNDLTLIIHKDINTTLTDVGIKFMKNHRNMLCLLKAKPPFDCTENTNHDDKLINNTSNNNIENTNNNAVIGNDNIKVNVNNKTKIKKNKNRIFGMNMETSNDNVTSDEHYEEELVLDASASAAKPESTYVPTPQPPPPLLEICASTDTSTLNASVFKEMVIADNDYAECIIYNKLEHATEKRRILKFRKNISVSKLYDEIKTQFDLSENFLVSFNNDITRIIHKDINTKLTDVGIKFMKNRNKLCLLKAKPLFECTENKNHDDKLINNTSNNNNIENTNNNTDITKNNDNHTAIVSNNNDNNNNIENTNNNIELTNNDNIKVNVNIKKKIRKDKNKSVELNYNTEHYEEELVLGASASPTEPESTYVPTPPPPPPLLAICASTDTSTLNASVFKGKLYSNERSAKGYIGLVNQAMTCYLNSLLQALFMTPEFRNALYHWEYDNKDETKSIPYQLQKLFLNLQTSTKSSVETTSLTRSFGWDSSEAWQQHDIQELCRVMFDALEQKFKNTDQSDLINHLYEGKMIDYVKCLECSTEKSREDTFLDIPLPVRPFGSTIAYSSVEEALRAFVQPETLNGNNQYFCEKCNKKCDAHKGLKFTKFPYILTLHLKRFDFDYTTFNRIKLNDKVTFPQTLNLNNLINELNNENSLQNSMIHNHNNVESTPSEHGSTESAIKCDDSSTIESSSAIDDDCCLPNNNTIGSSGASSMIGAGGTTNISYLQDDDEGIDVSGCSDNKLYAIKVKNSGPYEYELFSIMIHSGSATGGHYYAYIKDFETGDWYCFNDQNVSSITHEDIQKSFGGGGRSHYSATYSPSTNAYMLMYRQVDPVRNASAIKHTEFPVHIVQLLERLKNEENNKSSPIDMLKLKVYFFNPKLKYYIDKKIYITPDSLYLEVLETACRRLNVDAFAPIERCRLVAYSDYTNSIYKSFDDDEIKKSISDICESLPTPISFLLEIRDENSVFENIEVGSMITNVYTIDAQTNDIQGPITIRINITGTVGDYKIILCKRLKFNLKNIVIATINNGIINFLLKDENVLQKEEVHSETKIIVNSFNGLPTPQITQMKKCFEKFKHLITLHVALPKTNKEILDKMSIPSYNPNENKSTITSQNKINSESENIGDTVLATVPNNSQNNNNNMDSNGGSGDTHHLTIPVNDSECNSEDSSLSDGDRTLVELIPDNLSPLNTTATTSINSLNINSTIDSNNNNNNINSWDMDTEMVDLSQKDFYSKIECYEEPSYDETDNKETTKMLKVHVDNRFSLGNFKRLIEPYVKVPREYFKIFQMTVTNTEKECTQLNEQLHTFNDGQRLTIELGRALRPGEFRCKILYLKLSDVNDDSVETLRFLFEWIIQNGALAGDVKRGIIAHLSTIDEHRIPFENCRLRRKTLKAPSTVYVDEQKFGEDITLTAHMEIILQEIEDPVNQSIQDPDDVCAFVRWYHPSTLKLDSIQEIGLQGNMDIKTAMSKLSNIPEERIVYMKINGSFPRYNLSLIKLHGLFGWLSDTLNRDDWIFKSIEAHIFVFKDKDEEIKEITTEERRDIVYKENLRTERLSTTAYSPRRERALKIYLDTSPNKRND